MNKNNNSIEKVIIEPRLILALANASISMDKVIQAVSIAIAKKTDMELAYILARVEFYGASSNVIVEYELLYNDELEQVELEIRLWTLEIENLKIEG